ncbi:MAG: LEPR-XLL domain-containing protein, partial [Planctomycetota bacterium]|nr:LEPR-XLL domain-containing protein [Planctomycetota bacterium]
MSGRRRIPQFEALEPRLLLSADLNLIPLQSPQDYGAFLFQRSLLAESIAAQQPAAPQAGSGNFAPFAGTAASYGALVNRLDRMDGRAPSALDAQPLRPIDTALDREAISNYVSRLQSRISPVESLNRTLAQTGGPLGAFGPLSQTPAVTPGGVDLNIITANAPNVARAGDTITVSWNVVNQGDAPVNSAGWYDTVYFSPDNILHDSDIVLESRWVSDQRNLGADQTYTRTAEIEL